MRDDNRRLVYSTDDGWKTEEPKQRKKATLQTPGVPDDGIVRVARDRRRGGIMSVVTGLGEMELASVAKALKKLCGTGGTAKNGAVEIQGDHRDKIVAYFEKEGRRVKKAGG
jgi:translation initiation factor 1